MTHASRILGGLPFLGAALILLYEWLAYSFGLDPTLSKIIAYHIQNHPNRAVVVAFMTGGLVFLLVSHFAGALPWWKP